MATYFGWSGHFDGTTDGIIVLNDTNKYHFNAGLIRYI